MGLKIAAFVLPLGLDTLAVSIALGLRAAPLWRVAVTFALFEAAVPLVGIAAATFVPPRWEAAATIFGGGLLIVLGVHTLKESREIDEEAEGLSFRSFRFAMAAGLSISLDELAIGFPLKLAHLPIGLTIASIGVQAFVAAAVGVRFGSKLGERFAGAAAALAGVVFILLGGLLIAEQVR
ncbi:MAG TPA: manganese efflux pump [Candidatus Baltobacteraceae bacterium]|nr:manganese efflux pump [Candidatus Baltobacteraceae bacterium]